MKLVPLDRPHQAATLRWMNDPGLMPALNRLRPITAEEHDRWFASLNDRGDLACFAIETLEASTHVGNVWLNAIDPDHRKAEVRIMLDPDYQKRGLGSAAILELQRMLARGDRITRLYAYVLATNLPAQGAFRKAGFAVEGTLRADRWDGKNFVDLLILGQTDFTPSRKSSAREAPLPSSAHPDKRAP